MDALAGRTAIVTGASSGIGLCVAKALAREGMNLVLAARSGDKLERAAAEIGGQAVAMPTDVADVADLNRLVDRTLATFDSIDVLVNNAGIETYFPYHELDVHDIVRTVEVNLTATLVLTRLVLPHMLSAGRGRVVNMSSTAGMHGPAYGAAYGASKSGMIAFTESLRAEYRGSGVSASVICPGFTNAGGMYERMKRQIGRGTPALMGSTSAAAVASAVVRAIRGDLPQVVVNWPPVRPAVVLAQAFPTLGQWVIRKATGRFLKKVAHSRRSSDDAQPASSIIRDRS
jgi:short-subunit dehydrogenase